MKTLLFLLSVCFCLVSCSANQEDINGAPDNRSASSSQAEQGTQDVSFCDLIQFPEKYERKPVRVKAIYCDCAENSSLYSETCPSQKKVWVKGGLGNCKNAGRIDAFRSSSKNEAERMWGSWIFGVVAEGRLVGTNGGYGQMNRYDYLFEIDCLDRAERLDREGHPDEDVKKRIEEFEKSK